MNHILLCHIRLCHILLCHILLHHIPMYHIVLDCIVFFCIVSFSISFYYIVLLLFFHIICYVTICVIQFQMTSKLRRGNGPAGLYNQDFMKCPKWKGIWNTSHSHPFFFLASYACKKHRVIVRWIWLSCNISTLASRWRTCGISQVLICGKVQRSMRFFLDKRSKERSFW